MKVALIKSPWWVRYCPPYILGFFAALLRDHGHQAYPYDLNNMLYYDVKPEFRKYWDDRDYYSFWEDPAFIQYLFWECGFDSVLEKITLKESRIFCFTTHTPNVLISLKLAEEIKNLNKDAIVIFMGHKCSRAQMAHDFIRYDSVDYVCTGEADIALPELLSKLEGRRRSDMPECKGFLLKKDGNIIDCGDPQIVADLDSVPFPDYSDLMETVPHMPYSQPCRLDILDSRGCVNACHFCYERLYWQKFRTMSAQRIYEQINCHYNQFPGIDTFY
ncbi:B12-binding domain-containing radical SAM protein, partial [Elusimicrobiota bacterium]